MRRNTPVCWKCDFLFPDVLRMKPAKRSLPAPSRCLITSCRRRTWPSIVIRSQALDQSRVCLFVPVQQDSFLALMTPLAPHRCLIPRSRCRPDPEGVPPCFVPLVSDDGALISFSFVSSSGSVIIPRSIAPG